MTKNNIKKAWKRAVRKHKRYVLLMKLYDNLGRHFEIKIGPFCLGMKEPNNPPVIPMKLTKKDKLDEPSTWTGYYTPEEYLHIVNSNVFNRQIRL